MNDANAMTTSAANGEGDERCPSGIAGLDDILGGGFPRNCFYLLQGDPGAGKTTLALQFLLEGMRRGESVFYITLSESKRELLMVAHSHGWALEELPMLESSAMESLVQPEAVTTVFHSSEVELKQVSGKLIEQIRRLRPARVVVDSLSDLRLMAETPLRHRHQLLNLKQEFARHQSTVLLLDDQDQNQPGPNPLSIAHGLISLDQVTPNYGVTRRRLQVRKLRGVKYREGYHDFKIQKGGLTVFPRLIATEHHAQFERQPASSGIKELDDLLGGGLDRGTTTLIIGQAGTGKTSMAMHYAAQMAEHGEASLIYAFDETRNLLVFRAQELGLDVEKHIASGIMTVQQVDSATLSPGEFASQIVKRVQAGCKLVLIDSLTGYLNSMAGENHLANHLHELSGYLNQQGVVTILILAQHGLLGAAQSPVDISYLADTVVNIRYFESAGVVRQALTVVKKRSGHHEKTLRQMDIVSGRGLRLGPPLPEFQGVLSSIPEFRGAPEQILTPTDGGK